MFTNKPPSQNAKSTRRQLLKKRRRCNLMVQAQQAHRDALTEKQWDALRAPVNEVEAFGARCTAGVQPAGPGRISGRAFMMMQACKAAAEARRVPLSARRVVARDRGERVPLQASIRGSRLGRAAADAPELKKVAEEFLAPQL